MRNWRKGFGISCHRKNEKFENGFWPFLPQEKLEIAEWVLGFLASGKMLANPSCCCYVFCAPLSFPDSRESLVRVSQLLGVLSAITWFHARLFRQNNGGMHGHDVCGSLSRFLHHNSLFFSLSERLREISVFFLERRTTSSAATRSCVGEKIGLFVPIRVSFIEEHLLESELLRSFSSGSTHRD